MIDRIVAETLSQKNISKTLLKVSRNLEALTSKVDLILASHKRAVPAGAIAEKTAKNQIPCEALDVMTLLSLPDHLRKTAVTICALRSATAADVAGETRRARAVESNYLNQLVTMKYIQRERKGKKVYFYVSK